LTLSEEDLIPLAKSAQESCQLTLILPLLLIMKKWRSKTTFWMRTFRNLSSSQLSYISIKEQTNASVSKVTDNFLQKETPHVQNEIPVLNNVPTLQGNINSLNNTNDDFLQEVINIQLLYDINQAME